MMRTIQGLLLLAFLAAVGVFAYQNSETVTLRFLSWQYTTTKAIEIVAVYLLGMLSGWTVVSILRRSLRAATAPEPRQR